MIKHAISNPGHLLQGVLEKCARLNIPTQAILELTYRCNLRCVHCYVDIDEPDEMDTEEWKRIIDRLKSAGVISLLITGGESTVRDDFLEIAAYARRSGFFISLSTNCTLLNPDMARDIAELKPFIVNTSLYGATAASHEAVTRVGGSFENTLEGIRALVACGIKPLIQTLVMKTNMNELEQIKGLAAGLGVEINIDIGMTPTKTGNVAPFQYEPSQEELVRSGWRPENAQSNGPGLCKAGKSTLSVAPNGDVFPCTIFPLKLGNMRHADFNILWHTEPCAELRYLRSMSRTDLYACNKCELSVYCQRCPGIAYLESGDFISPGSSSCRQAEVRRHLIRATEVTK